MNNLPEKLAKIVKEVDEQIAGRLHEIDEQVVYNQAKVLEAFVDNAVADKRRELAFHIREVDVLLHECAERIGVGLWIELADLLHHQFHLFAHIAMLEIEEQAGR